MVKLHRSWMSVAVTSNAHCSRVPRERGMTLIEILVVLMLIGVVLGIVGSNYLGKSEQAKAKAAKIEIEQIAQSLDLFKLELGRYPTTQEGLQALITAPPGLANWNGPYWKKSTAAEGPVVARIQVRGAGHARRVRHHFARRRWRGRRRGRQQGHHELVTAAAVTAPRATSCGSRTRGVTLLELLIVLAMMAIVAGFVIPMFGGPVSTSELRASARQLAAGLRLARSEALAERRETFLVARRRRQALQGGP